MGFEWVKVENFRCLNRLHIEQLGQVNLITGRNSVGKSYLLEALELCGAEATLATLLRQMAERGQLAEPAEQTGKLRSFGALPRHRFDTVFHGWAADMVPAECTLATDRGPVAVALELCATHGPDGPEEDLRLCLTRNGQRFSLDLFARDPVAAAERDELLALAPRGDHAGGGAACFRWRVGCPDQERLAKAWDRIGLLPEAATVIGILQLVHPEVTGVQFVESPTRRREAQVKLREVAKPVPLGSLGDGALRLLTIAVALATSVGEVLLLDEIDAGLHYSVQPDLWRVICQTARELNVQVFATTHSCDCVLGFQRALCAEPDTRGFLHRLQAASEGIRTTTLGVDELAAATAADLEVRG